MLLVKTNAASNRDEMLGIELRNTPVAVPDAPGLRVLNIDPDNAAKSYRLRVLAKMEANATAAEVAAVREQLSGACTTEIASLLDAGYVTVTPDLGFEVSHRIREEFENGRHSYELHGQPIVAPADAARRPDRAALAWHNAEDFQG